MLPLTRFYSHCFTRALVSNPGDISKVIGNLLERKNGLQKVAFSPKRTVEAKF